MNKHIKIVIIVAVVFIFMAIFSAIAWHYRTYIKNFLLHRNQPTEIVSIEGISNINYAKEFADMQNLQIAAAKKYGLKNPPNSRKDIDKKATVEIETCESFKLDKLTHSAPYLVPTAAREIEKIGNKFRTILKDHNLPEYKIIVTSVLRTKEDVKRLQKSGNPNASSNSAHCYGTTFDISYIRFYKCGLFGKSLSSETLKMVLANVLKSERDEGRIYVKYEKMQKCFHITCRY